MEFRRRLLGASVALFAYSIVSDGFFKAPSVSALVGEISVKELGLSDNKNQMHNQTIHLHLRQFEDGDDTMGEALPRALSQVTLGSAKDVTAECIKQHNHYRQTNLVHPLPSMTKNDSAAKAALDFMLKNANEDCANFSHSNTLSLGENLYGSNTPSCEDATFSWYDEIKLYGSTYPGKFEMTQMRAAHFTQALWETSVGLGCAMTTTCSKLQFLVCNYTPAGNFLGAYPFSVSTWDDLYAREQSWNAAVVTPEGTPSSAGTIAEWQLHISLFIVPALTLISQVVH